MSLEKYLSETERHLTMGDIRKLTIGDTLDVVFLDRNWQETNQKTWVTGNKVSEFFSENRGTLVYVGDMTWDINGKYRHPVHLYVGDTDEYWDWYPVNEMDISNITDDARVGYRGPIILYERL